LKHFFFHDAVLQIDTSSDAMLVIHLIDNPFDIRQTRVHTDKLDLMLSSLANVDTPLISTTAGLNMHAQIPS